MIEYKNHIDMFSLEGSSWFSKLTLESEWGDVSLAENYLKKYWLSEDEYNLKWKSIQKEIFTSLDTHLPNLVFREKYMIIALRGGCLFLKKDFEQLRKCLIRIGETHLIIVENTFGNELEEPSFRMKYPSTISWEELTSGNFISSTILEHPHKEFFVFGASGNFGKYSANDYEQPLDIIGFKPKYECVFRTQFKQSQEEWEEIKEWLPPKYNGVLPASKSYNSPSKPLKENSEK